MGRWGQGPGQRLTLRLSPAPAGSIQKDAQSLLGLGGLIRPPVPHDLWEAGGAGH